MLPEWYKMVWCKWERAWCRKLKAGCKWCHLHTAHGVWKTTPGTSHTARAQLLGPCLHGFSTETPHISSQPNRKDISSQWSWRHLCLLRGLLPTGAESRGHITLHLIFNLIIFRMETMFQHQEHGRTKVAGTIHVPLAWLHDAARYWSAHSAFSSADAPALWSPHQASRISHSSGTCSLPPHRAGGFNQTFQYNLLTNDLLLPQRSHGIPIWPKHEFLFPTRSSRIKMLIRSPWMQQMKPVAPLISPWLWGKGSAFRLRSC